MVASPPASPSKEEPPPPLEAAGRVLDACQDLYARFEDEDDGLISLHRLGCIILALERAVDETGVQSLILTLTERPDAAVDFTGLCEVVCHVMKGAPHTRDTLVLLDHTGARIHSSLADVARLQLKALYTMHPAFDDQSCWLRLDEAYAPHCVAEGEGIETALTNQPATLVIEPRDWVHHETASLGGLSGLCRSHNVDLIGANAALNW